MKKRSLLYKYPLLYILGLRLIHRSNFSKRYRYMASFVKPSDVVLEPACGPGILANFLPKNSHYFGFDTNGDFLAYALSKSRAVKTGNVLNKKSYISSDVIVACDILHHLNPKDRKIFIQYCFSHAKRFFIICEPAENSKKGDFFYPLRRRLAEWLEQDGTNKFDINHFFSYQEFANEISTGFRIIPDSIKRKVKRFGQDTVVVFQKTAES